VLIDVLADKLPPGPPLYPDGELTDEPEEVLMAELIREAALEGLATSCRSHWPSSSTR
jgi:GTP-binding protein Era